MHHQSFNKAFDDEEDILDFLLYSDILNNYHFLQCLQKLNIEPKKQILKWQKEQELIKAKSKQMFQYMNRSKKPKISSSETSVIFSGNSSSEQIEEEEKKRRRRRRRKRKRRRRRRKKRRRRSRRKKRRGRRITIKTKTRRNKRCASHCSE